MELFYVSSIDYPEKNCDIIYQQSIFVNLQLRQLGGKGGFGSMLKTIGSQISKTKNKDSCRNLQGERILTVNKTKNAAKAQDEANKDIKKESEVEKLEKRLDKVSTDNIKVSKNSAKYHQEHENIIKKNEKAIFKGIEAAKSKNEKCVDAVKTTSKKSVLDDLDDLLSSSDSSNG